MDLLNGVELPALEDGCVNKKLLVSTDVPLSSHDRDSSYGA